MEVQGEYSRAAMCFLCCWGFPLIHWKGPTAKEIDVRYVEICSASKETDVVVLNCVLQGTALPSRSFC